MTATITWKKDADGDWGTASNWNPARLPDADDSVRINTADFHTITYSGDTATVGSLSVGNDAFSITSGTFTTAILTLSDESVFANRLLLGDATLNLNGTAVVNGAFSASSDSVVEGPANLVLNGGGHLDGTMRGSGTTLLSRATSVSDLILDNGRVLENQGTLTASGAFGGPAVMVLGHSSGPGTVRNDPGAAIDFIGNAIVEGGVAGSSLSNSGTIDCSGSFSLTQIVVPFLNMGTITVASGGGLLLQGGSSSVSGIALGTQAFLIVGGLFDFTGGGTLGTSTSQFSLEGGTAAFDAATTLAGSIQVSGSDSAISGSGDLTVAGSILLQAPLSFSSGGKTVLQGDTDLQFGLTIDGRTVENQATMTLDHYPAFLNSVVISLDGSGVLQNDAGGEIIFQGAVQGISENGIFGAGNKAGEIINAGTIDGEVDSTLSHVTLVNRGTVEAHFGKMAITGHMSGSGTVEVDDTASFTFDGSATTKANHVDVETGTGNASLTGGSGDDKFTFGANFQATDHVDGGAGTDMLSLSGDYSAGLAFAAGTLSNVETLHLGAGFDYDLQTVDANVAAGATLVVDGSPLHVGNSLTFDGSAETDGHFVFVGGHGADTFTGGSLSDTFVYQSAAASSGPLYDTVVDANFDLDRFDVPGDAGTVNGLDAAVSGTLDSGANFDSELKAALHHHLSAHHALLFTASAGTLSGETFLIVDVNGADGYQSGGDLVIHLTGATGTLSTADFI